MKRSDSDVAPLGVASPGVSSPRVAPLDVSSSGVGLPGIALHDSLSGKKRPFAPQMDDHVRIYVCGPTVYDRPHVGNARPMVVFDVLVRLLRRRYRRVTYVRNITDVDDKIIEAAKRRDEDITTLTDRMTRGFIEDMQALDVQEPDHQPRATEHIADMIAMIETLLERQHAYVSQNHVLFAVASAANYGMLSKRLRQYEKAGARVDIADYKREPEDFILWKPAGEGPGWDSPWGRGRPGWHIECSAMSHRYLTTPFDIHGGGADLLFPHHENEMAQSCCALGLFSMASFWLHNGTLTMEGEKMAKSLGNIVTIRDACDAYGGEVVRAFLLGTHYRRPVDWSIVGLKAARSGLDRLYEALRDAVPVDRPVDQGNQQGGGQPIDADMEAALADDLNTPKALAALYALARRVSSLSGTSRQQAQNLLRISGNLLGILHSESDQWFQNVPSAANAPKVDDAWIDERMALRDVAREGKNWDEADRLREELEQHGIILEDTSGETRWKRQ